MLLVDYGICICSDMYSRLKTKKCFIPVYYNIMFDFVENLSTAVVDSTKNMTLPMQRIVVKHNTIANRTFTQ